MFLKSCSCRQQQLRADVQSLLSNCEACNFDGTEDEAALIEAAQLLVVQALSLIDDVF